MSSPVVIPCPNGSVVTTDPRACRIALHRDGIMRWDRELTGCAGLLEATVAMDSTVYVRDAKTISSFSYDGVTTWSAKLDEPAVPHAIATPTSLADSRAALASSTKSLSVYERDGRVSWTFSPPTDETIIAPPAGMKTEGIVLMTSQAVYYLGATGETRWRVATPGRSATR